MALLKDAKFHELCKVLKVTDQIPSDPDRKVIEKAFRRCALKTHPDKVIQVTSSGFSLHFAVVFYVVTMMSGRFQ